MTVMYVVYARGGLALRLSASMTRLTVVSSWRQTSSMISASSSCKAGGAVRERGIVPRGRG